jgi:hypothetical protein
LYGLYPVFLHGSGNAVFAARFTNFMQISMDPTITVDSVAQRIGVADKFQQSLVILFSGRNRLIKPDIKSSTGISQNPKYCYDRPDLTVIIDEAVLRRAPLQSTAPPFSGYRVLLQGV